MKEKNAYRLFKDAQAIVDMRAGVERGRAIAAVIKEIGDGGPEAQIAIREVERGLITTETKLALMLQEAIKRWNDRNTKDEGE
jgi:hypothetical protein